MFETWGRSTVFFMFVVIFLHFIFPNGIYVNVPAILYVALGKAPKKNRFYLGLCPKLWVGGGQKS